MNTKDTSKAVRLVAVGIKCDNEDCDYKDMEADFDPDEYLNKPCPQCGSNLFTLEDYQLLQSLEGAADIVNELFAGVDLTESPEVGVRISSDGAGGIKELSLVEQ